MLPSLVLAWLITFNILFAIGGCAFFVTKSMALLNLYFALFSLFSGYLLPLPLLPGWLAEIAAWLPFRFMLSAPVEIMTRALDGAELAAMMAAQLAWTVASLVLALAVWRAGLRRFEAVGG